MQRMILIAKKDQKTSWNWKTIAVLVLALVLIVASLAVIFGVLGGRFEWL
jgi:ABC-type polysaccharide/polyol phosphate export permease